MTIPTVGLHKVRKPFEVDGRRVPTGEIVDVTGWRNGYQLVDRGYLVAIPSGSVEADVEVPSKAPISPPNVLDADSAVVGSSCPTCGSGGDTACVTRAGKPKPSRHSSRS